MEYLVLSTLIVQYCEFIFINFDCVLIVAIHMIEYYCALGSYAALVKVYC